MNTQLMFAAALVGLLAGLADQPQNEAFHRDRLAPLYDAQAEVRLWDGTRVDLRTDTYAIEIDWPQKWAEAIGQSLYYAEVTGLEPGIILLVRDMDSDRRHVYRCQTVCARAGIRLFVEIVE